MANGQTNNKKKKIIIFSSIGVLLLAVVLVVVFKGNKEEVINVQTEKVERRTITQSVSATGTIDPEFKVVITPEVTGEIVALPVKEGDRVKKGQLLLKIKADSYVAQVEREEANLMSAKASLSMRKAELDKVTSDYNRMMELHSKKLASDAELEAAKSVYLSLKAQYESAQAYVKQSEANLKQTREQLYKTTISSPIDGIVTQLNVELGERVLGSGFSQGTNIMTVADLSKMEAIVDVDENDVVLISMGDTARIKVDALNNQKITGIVTQIGNSAKQTGIGTQDQVINFEVRIKLIDPDKALRPGMSCTATIETETKQNVLAVPIPSVTARIDAPPAPEGDDANSSNAKPAVKKNGDKPQELVFILDGNKVKTMNVTTGISDDNYLEVTGGLKGGEEVVSGSYKAISRELKDGSVVKVDNKHDGKDAKPAK